MQSVRSIKAQPYRDYSMTQLTLGIVRNAKRANTAFGSMYDCSNVIITKGGALSSLAGVNELCNHILVGNDADKYTFKRVVSEPILIDRNGMPALIFLMRIVKKDDGKEFLAIGASNLNAAITLDYIFPGEKTIPEKYRYQVMMDGKIMFYNNREEPFLYDTQATTADKKIINYHPITDPETGPTLSTTFPASGDKNFVLRVRVAFHSNIGITKGSKTTTISLVKDVVEMNANDKITIKRPEPKTGETPTGWSVYAVVANSAAGATSTMYRLNEFPIKMGTKEFVFDNNTEFRIDKLCPEMNSTHPLYFDYAQVVNSRIWATGNVKQWSKSTENNNAEGMWDHPYRVCWSGTNEDAFTFSAEGGSGYLAIEGGGKNYPKCITYFRKNDGDEVPVVLTGNLGSHGKRYRMESIGLSDSGNREGGTLNTFQAIEQSGNVGTVAGQTVCVAGTNLYYLSTEGLISTQTNPEIQNVLVNDIISEKISDIIDELPITKEAYDFIEARSIDSRVFWLMQDRENRVFILVYDMLAKAFTKLDTPDGITPEHIFVYEGNAHSDIRLCFIASEDGKMYTFTTDTTNIQHPLLKSLRFNYTALDEARTYKTYGRIIKVFYEMENVTNGEYYFSYRGITRDMREVTQEQEKIIPPEHDYGKYAAPHFTLVCRPRNRLDIIGQVGSYFETYANFRISKIGYTFAPMPVNYANHPFEVRGPHTDQIIEPPFMLQPQDVVPQERTRWLDNHRWQDHLYWKEG